MKQIPNGEMLYGNFLRFADIKKENLWRWKLNRVVRKLQFTQAESSLSLIQPTSAKKQQNSKCFARLAN
jgi:hypothetical protein